MRFPSPASVTARGLARCALSAAILAAPPAMAQEPPKLLIGGTIYTKWLWGTQRTDGSLYDFTTLPGEGYADNGQGSEVELLIDAKLSRQVAMAIRLYSRFNQNHWTNFGGFGGMPGSGCTGGDCGGFDPRSSKDVKLRGVNVTLTPGYRWVDAISIGANDFGMFDPFVIGRIRYVDRDNASGLLFSGSAAGRRFAWDVTRIALPRLWAGPNFNTGLYTAGDAAYGAQAKLDFGKLEIGLIGQYVYDVEVENRRDVVDDDGNRVRTRFRNTVVGAKLAVRPNSWIDLAAAYYASRHDSVPDANIDIPGGPGEQTPGSFFGLSGFSPVVAGRNHDDAWYVNAGFSNIAGSRLTVNAQIFAIGAAYTSMMAARRESDVLLTEGHDAAWAFPGPSNGSFGVFEGHATRIGYGGWMGNAVQVPTINVDNELTDFDETMAETAVGWKGVTVIPTWRRGSFEVHAEISRIGYNTDWQAFGDPARPVGSTKYPVHELDTGVGHNFRSAYAPFQNKETLIAVLEALYVLDAGRGIDLFGKVKVIRETDDRLHDPRFLPFVAGDCPGGDAACGDAANPANGGSDVAAIYANPDVVATDLNGDGDTLDAGEVGYRWKPFDDVADDDRDLKYVLYRIGGGYQLSDDLYGQITYEFFDVALQDGNTAFQAYQLHEMASGAHRKNILTLGARYLLAGAEFGLQYQHAWGEFTPDFGTGFTPTFADAVEAASVGVREGSLGFAGRLGGWNSLEKREYRQNRLKAFMKVRF